METKKVLGIIFSILFIGAFAFVLSWGIINFNKVQDSLSGTGVYTKEDVDNAYKDGYSTALDNEKSYTELIDSYRDIITTQTDEISKLNSQIITLTNNNNDYSTQISNLTTQRNNLQNEVDNLSEVKTQNELLIDDLNLQIEVLQKQVSDLKTNNVNKDNEIAQKNTQIANLQNTVTQLQKTNDLNSQTISNLNSQIVSLNSQISEITLQIQNNSANVTALNNKISELEKSVSYYEQYIANLENGEQVVATFEFNGSVYNIQIVNKNDTVSVVNPTSTDYVIFNYWTVNGEQIDLSTYQISSNTKIVANVTYKYDVKFMVDDIEFNKQIVIKNGYATIPTEPTKTGYEFDGWTINGVDIIDLINIPIIENTIFIAKFTKLHTVTFIYEDITYTTQKIRNGNVADEVIVDDTTYKSFNGWTINGTIVDLSSYKIIADTTFVADIIYSYDVDFIVDNNVIYSQIVKHNNYVTLPTNPEKNRYEFVGWSIDGINVVDVVNMPITNNISFVCIWKQKVGFETEFINSYSGNFVNNSYYGDVWSNEKYVVGRSVLGNYYCVTVVNKLTNEVDIYKCATANGTSVVCNIRDCYLYNNKFYFYCGRVETTTGTFNMIDLEAKTVTKLINHFNTGFNSINYYQNKMIAYCCASSSSYQKSNPYYYIYDLDNNVYVDNIYDYSAKIGSNFYGNIYSEILVNGCLISLGKATNLSNSSYAPNSMVVINIVNGTHTIVQLTTSSSKKPSLATDGENLYINYNNKYALFDFTSNTVGEFNLTSIPTSYHTKIGNYKFKFNANQTVIVDNLGNEVTIDNPTYNGTSLKVLSIEKVTDTQYLCYFSTDEQILTYYLWL